jgi:hypothetical protein
MNENEVKRAAESLLVKVSGFRYSCASSRPGVDIEVRRRGLSVGMIEVKKAWDLVPTDYTAIRLLYEGLGQLMYHGRSRFPSIPLGIWFGALRCRDGRPILSSRWPKEEKRVRERLRQLDVHLILWCKEGNAVSGIEEFIVALDRYFAELSR